MSTNPITPRTVIFAAICAFAAAIAATLGWFEVMPLRVMFVVAATFSGGALMRVVFDRWTRHPFAWTLTGELALLVVVHHAVLHPSYFLVFIGLNGAAIGIGIAALSERVAPTIDTP